MTFDELLYDAANITLLSAVFPTVGFVYRYGRHSAWRTNEVGKTIMYLACSLAALLIWVSASLFFAPFPGWLYIRLALYCSLPVVMGNMFLVLLRFQREQGRCARLLEEQREILRKKETQ